jgi:hypothetical protein
MPFISVKKNPGIFSVVKINRFNDTRSGALLHNVTAPLRVVQAVDTIGVISKTADPLFFIDTLQYSICYENVCRKGHSF